MSSPADDLFGQFEYILCSFGFRIASQTELTIDLRGTNSKTNLRQLDPVHEYGPSIHFIAPPSLH